VEASRTFHAGFMRVGLPQAEAPERGSAGGRGRARGAGGSRHRSARRQTRAGGDADGPGELNPERGARRSGAAGAVAGRNGTVGARPYTDYIEIRISRIISTC
jgi:hypothetical protein